MSGFRTWVAGEVLTADNMQDYLQNQTVMPFANATARGTDLIVTLEGQITYLEDTQKFYVYNGSSWVELLPNGGTAGQPYVSAGASDPAFGDVKAEFIALTLQGKSANYTVQASDTNTVLNFTTAATVTVPDVLTDVGDRVDILMNASSGSVTIVAGSGVTSWAGAGTSGLATEFTMPIFYTAASVIKTAASEYRVIGRVFA